jgi:Tat protein secretion system quality control protein TatD with DNase activity
LAKNPPSKEDHYRSIFFPANKEPNGKHMAVLDSLLPYLPDPLPFAPLLDTLRTNITTTLANGKIAMLGEVGLDGGARMRWPKAARHLYEEKYPVQDGLEEDWNRLTPFKVSMAHQKAIVEAQLEVAIDLGVSVSFHSVAAPGEWLNLDSKAWTSRLMM